MQAARRERDENLGEFITFPGVLLHALIRQQRLRTPGFATGKLSFIWEKINTKRLAQRFNCQTS